MARRNRKILTKNKEVYSKFNSLFFMNEIVLTTTTDQQVTKILNSINRNDVVLTKEKIGDKFIIKKVGPLDFSIYFQNN